MSGAVALQVADPYAEALVSLASSQNALDAFTTDIRFILAALDLSPELKLFLSSPVIKAETKKDLLQRVFGDQVNPMIVNTLKLLADRRRVTFLESVCRRFLELQRKLQKVALADVTSAIELNEGQKQAIIERVQQFSRANSVELQAKTDASLLGGVIIKVGSQVIDLSLRGQLRRLTLQLT